MAGYFTARPWNFQHLQHFGNSVWTSEILEHESFSTDSWPSFWYQCFFVLRFTNWNHPPKIIQIVPTYDYKCFKQNLMNIYYKCDSHVIHKLIQGQLKGSVSFCMCSNLPSDWLTNYIKDTQSVFNVSKIAGYFLDRSCICK